MQNRLFWQIGNASYVLQYANIHVSLSEESYNLHQENSFLRNTS